MVFKDDIRFGLNLKVREKVFRELFNPFLDNELETNISLYNIVEEHYPRINLSGYSQKGSLSFGISHEGITDIKTFRETFGKNVKRGFV